MDLPATIVDCEFTMTGWKRFLLIGFGWGTGTGVALAASLAVFLWYQARPKPPKPWDTSSIKATYDYMDTEGDKNTIAMFYTLENTTDFDYRIQDKSEVTMNAKLGKQSSLSEFKDDFSRIDYPIFIPAKKRIFFSVHIAYPYSVKENPNADKDEKAKYNEDLTKYVNQSLNNLYGFELLDPSKRYDIVFDAGWKKDAKQEKK